MNQPTASPASSPGTRRRCRRVVVVVVLLLGIAWAGFFVVTRLFAVRNLAETIAALDQAEPGWRLADLEKGRRPVEAERNAATVVQAAASRLPPGWSMPASLEKLNDARSNIVYPPSHAAALSAEMAKCSAALEAAWALAKLDAGRFPIQYAPDWEATSLAHAQSAREVAAVLCLDAHHQAQRGEMSKAIDACRAALHAGRALGDEPMLISQLIRLSIRSQAVAALIRVLAQGEANPKDLEALQQSLEKEAREDVITPAIRGERAGWHHLLELAEENRLPMSAVQGKMTLRLNLLGARRTSKGVADWLGGNPLQGAHASILEHCTGALTILEKPLAEQAEAWADLEKEVLSSPPLARDVMRGVFHFAAGARRNTCNLECAALGVAAERFRIEQGHWPAKPEDLAPRYLHSIPTALKGGTLRFVADKDTFFVHFTTLAPHVDASGETKFAPPSDRMLDWIRQGQFELWNVAVRRSER